MFSNQIDAVTLQHFGLRRCCEIGLGICLFALPAMLALVPHGAAPLEAVAALCAAGLIVADRPRGFAALYVPAGLLGAVLLWSGLSVAWAIDPARSLVMEMRLAGLFAAALVLAAAAGRLAAPHRSAWWLTGGVALGIGLAFADLASSGMLTQLVSVRPFAGPRLNQLAACAALLAWPIAALFWCRGWRAAAILAGLVIAASVFALDDTTAKLGLALSLPAAALMYWRRTVAVRAFAALTVLAILLAPVTLPHLAHSPALFAKVDGFKESAGHRLLIWSFTGDRIAERPFLGWGLDSARAIPGGKDEIRPGENWLPLHPHDAALQVWLELGAPGAALFALIAALVWMRLAAAAWPLPYAAAAGGALTVACVILLTGWGIWEEWWLATLSLCLFAVMAMVQSAHR